MNAPLQTILLPFLERGLETQNQNIKLLLYKKDADIFNSLDFESETIYQEPLFFSYFNNAQSYGPIQLTERLSLLEPQKSINESELKLKHSDLNKSELLYKEGVITLSI